MAPLDEPTATSAAPGRWQVVTPPRSPLRSRGDGTGFQIGVLWPTDDCAGAKAGDPAQQSRLAAQLERIGVDYVAVPEQTTGTGPVTAVGAWPANLRAVQVILATRTLGVVSAQRTSYVHPVHLARTGSHLDWLSGGRWGAWVDPVRTDAEDRLLGWTPEPGTPLERAAASLEAVSAIWHTPRGVPVEVDSAHFRIHGRVKYPQVIQPRPFVMISEPGIEALHLAALCADHYVAPAGSVAELVTIAGHAHEAAAQAARPTPLRVMARALIGLGESPAPPGEGSLPLSGDTAQVGGALAQIAELADVGGVLVELPDWSAEAVDLFGFVLDRLRAAGLWTSSGDRGYTW